ncbi:RNA polymerase sigma-70 factor (ECF subfamily) [Kribbella amoyensis]|uniref:RNA polymerase sigma-70 factor (ECF subfamily) n=1 Tax=Kribbella amoyensis TaxID=996641 RepID=A0A561C172_9ACTN|nr:RNA polymerase sigma factor [Kribbella amoyensis]TWD84838.1 RNA polymerase sigma-70 factor (ECF subfamily) [Kribbella amoyensis]
MDPDPERPRAAGVGPGVATGSGVQTDRSLWEELQSGDEAALTALFHRHADAVYNFAFRRTSSWATAEEVVQATFTTLWRRAKARRVDTLTLESARPLLLVMAGYECGTALRTMKRQSALIDRLELVGDHGTEPDHSAAAAARVDDELAMSDIRRILSRIPARQREAIELVVWSGCTVAEAAKALGVPEGTVKSRLARARTSLAGLIDLGTKEELR